MTNAILIQANNKVCQLDRNFSVSKAFFLKKGLTVRPSRAYTNSDDIFSGIHFVGHLLNDGETELKAIEW